MTPISMSISPWGIVTPSPGTQGTYGTTQNAPAYTPVHVRQNFTYPPAQAPQYPQTYPPSATEQPTTKRKIDWPLPVRHYVQRSFDPSNIVPDVARPAMEAKLKATISAATDSNQLDTIDWDHLPLPQEMIRSERAHAATLSWHDNPVEVPGTGIAYHNGREVQSKKRKSQELDVGDNENLAPSPPWRNTNNRNVFEDRISYPSPAPATRSENRPQAPQDDITVKASSKFQKNLEKRQRRFDGGYKSTYQGSPAQDTNMGPVIGRSTKLEKRFLRLTAAPNPDDVRPLPILKQTLELLKKKWRKEGNYSYICDQFKSLRQDLTVQHIRDKFTVEVYEIHARIALEKGDLGEYNQCQTQLRSLYEQKLGGNPMEFKAYRILYFIHTCNRTALNDILADLTPAEKLDLAVKHALDVRSALALGNYHRFFQLYLDTPNMGAYLMDMFVVRERLAALANICKAYKPDVKLRFISEELGFESDADAARFIYENKGSELLEERPDGIQVFTAKAGLLFERAKSEAFRKVDIKGQI